MAIKIVQTKYGKVEGVKGWDPTVRIFKGIPYAAPPVYDLRWKEPQPPEPWDGIKKCYEFSDICLQSGMGVEKLTGCDMNEDCLYLNVWTTAENGDEKMPVLFYVHGGGHNGGAGNYPSYDGEAIAKQGIVMVTFNYRINIFGYMTHPELKAESEHNATGNYGIMDMIFALKWVRENIAGFGGDPENITCMGLSAGAGCTRILCNTPLTKGMIKRAATMSVGGHLYSPDQRTTDGLPAENTYMDIKAVLGVDTIAEARKLSGDELFERFNAYKKKFGPFGLMLRPVVDGWVLPTNCNEIEENGQHHDIQYMIGVSADESPRPWHTMDLEAERKKAAGTYKPDELDAFIEAISKDETEEFKKSVYSHGAEHMRAASVGFCQLQLDLGRKPAYLYIMNRKVPGEARGAFHGSDLYYIFKSYPKVNIKYVGADLEFADMMNEMWSNYIKTGNPNAEGYPTWTPYTDEEPYTMVLDEKPRLVKIEDTTACKFLVDITRKARKERNA